LLTRCQGLRRRLVEHCSWEEARLRSKIPTACPMPPRFVAGPAGWTTPNLLFLFSTKRSPTLPAGWCLVTRPIRELGLCLG
jgi:hypothetical protein